MLDFALTNNTQYLALTGELWAVLRALFKAKWPRYIEGALYESFLGGVHQWQADSTHSGLVIRSQFPYQTIIIYHGFIVVWVRSCVDDK